MTTYSYPASRSPCETNASADSLIRFSFMPLWKVFQVFHPIGGFLIIISQYISVK